MSDQHKPTKKLVLLAAILAAGLLAAVFAASQLTATATAQSEDDQTTGTEEQAPVTSQDLVDCETDPSQVHCVEEAELISAPIEDGDKPTLSVTGTATAKTPPDMFSVTLGIETNATTAAEAASSNAELVNATIAALADLGIAEEQMATSSYNLFPVYSDVQPDQACIEIFPPPPGCEPEQVITGYKVSNSLTVTLETEGEIDAGTVIDTAIGAGANNVSGVFFFVSQERQEEIRDSLIADAIADARHKADVAATALEMQVSGIHSVSLADMQFPIFARGAESLQASTPILPGEQEVTSTVSITYFISAGAGTEETGGAEAEMEEGVGVESETETQSGNSTATTEP
ncbi:MAG: SIMPL domain-containing protein [Nitrososphaera sp.]|uniref:SIMPL domain-containing protein n=1 Tax=Nitrososphaera sp. TaxID=1971748 RepID=UPI0017F7AA7E|nr:SIMPL domain-containing protein [Nitrososphaera sp.]NWG37023.1 SIMPL domain-containing protein [Nitrososphaera sp.]